MTDEQEINHAFARSRSNAGLGVLPCPFCGNQPDISSQGTCIDFDCCCSMSIQKCDFLTIEERKTFNMETYMYSDEVESNVMSEIVSRWNTRASPNAAVSGPARASCAGPLDAVVGEQD